MLNFGANILLFYDSKVSEDLFFLFSVGEIIWLTLIKELSGVRFAFSYGEKNLVSDFVYVINLCIL